MQETRYFEHDADMGVIGQGATLVEAFVTAAEATFAIMCEPGQIAPRERIAFEFEESDPELALVTWLNRLLAEARAHGLALGRFALQREADHWAGEAWGEPWRPGLEPGVEVKGATLTMLEVSRRAGRWEARCVVDV